MPNHVHALLTPLDPAALGSLIKRVAQRYAQVRNKRYHATGKLFEQRYYSKPMNSEAHLALATAYIDLNPVRAGLVDEPSQYEWSTFHEHVGRTGGLPDLHRVWTPSEWYTRLGSSPSQRASAYRAWIDECLERDEWDAIRRDPPKPQGPAPIRPNRSRAAG